MLACLLGVPLVPGPASPTGMTEVTGVPHPLSLAAVFTRAANWPAAVLKASGVVVAGEIECREQPSLGGPGMEAGVSRASDPVC